MASFSASGGGAYSGAGRSAAKFQGPSNKVRSQGGFGAAAGMTDLAGVFSVNRQRAPRFDRMGANNISNRASERAAVMKAEAGVHAQGLQAMATVKSAETIADAQVAAAKAAASGAQSGAMMSGVGSIIGAGLSLLSDRTTKDCIYKIDDALTKLRELQPVTFRYKEEYGDADRLHHGFIAQEFQEVLPDATYFDEEKGKLCIDTMDLIGLLVRSVQQLETRVMFLEAQRALAGVK